MKPPLSVVLLFAALSAFAQSPPADSAPARTPQDGPFIPAPALPGGIVLPLYPPDFPLLKRERIHEAERYNTTSGGKAGKVQSTLNIHNPSIEAHPIPEGEANTGAAVIVAPGGGHQILWVGPEGYDTVPFFAKAGVATIVLRNRLRVDGYDAKVDAVNDAFQAIRLVRSHAAEWHIDPAKIGIIGFSAGAELAAPAALFFDDFSQKSVAADPLAQVSARPDFVGLIYPGPTPFARGGTAAIPQNVPPSFITCAGSGDRVHALWATEYFTAMLQASAPNVEMHIYGRGGHGGSLSPREGIPFGTWQDRYLEWFRDLGFLDQSGQETKAARDIAAYAKKKSGAKAP